MNINELKKLVDLSYLDPEAARKKAHTLLTPQSIEALRPIARWSDVFIASWESVSGPVLFRAGTGGFFWLTPSTHKRAILPPYPLLYPVELRALAQLLYPEETLRHE